MTGPSVSLIGSFRRHYAEIQEAARVLTAAGITVKSPPMSRIIDPERDFVRFAEDPPEATDLEIQAATMAKIYSSDFVYVVNPGGYIGQMTAHELGRVVERGMAVYYAELPQGFPIEVPEGTVLSAKELAAGLASGRVGTRPFRRPRGRSAANRRHRHLHHPRSAAACATDHARHRTSPGDASPAWRFRPARRITGGDSEAGTS